QEIIKFPEVRRDLSVVIDKNLTFDKLEQIIRQSGKQIIQKITVFDVYEGDKIEAGKKAYAMSITLQDEKQTLTDEAIDKTIGQIMNRLEKELGALIRK
ncbi:MAG TPA: phenylalanine--tRNA ligase subunit beta, partial [Catalimonadaceae bacterium]|nr:phenylalanine--tRNA ligase subunit beta [Catalimonadaceae bacterium]